MMKKSLILLGSAMLLFMTSHAQEKQKIQEVGFAFQSLDSYGLVYRFGNEKGVGRLTVLSLSAGGTDNPLGINTGSNSFQSTVDQTRSYSGGLKMGYEARVNLAPNFFFRSGFELGGSYGYQKEEGQIRFSDEFGNLFFVNGDLIYEQWTAEASAIIGFNYVVKDKLVLGVELLPTLQYRGEKASIETENEFLNTEDEGGTVAFDLGMTNALLSVAYRFGKN